VTVVVRGEAYVHVARALRFGDGTLTLVDPSPSTIWMSPMPPSGLGYLPTGAFLDLWTDPDRPTRPRVQRVRARLALLDADAQLAGLAALVVSAPRVSPSGLSYDAEVLEGLVPESSGACVLFLEWDTAPALSVERRR
jgi:hypothetical protein